MSFRPDLFGRYFIIAIQGGMQLEPVGQLAGADCAKSGCRKLPKVSREL
jgi:hypothetical protein